MMLGIDTGTGQIYEGRSYCGRELIPPPFIFPTVITSSSESNLNPSQLSGFYQYDYIFREEIYNSVTRTRSGRLYKRDSQLNNQWHFYDPSQPDILLHDKARSLATFYATLLSNEIKPSNFDQPILVLGSSGSFTIWSVVQKEQLVTGAEILFLKSRQNIAALPKLSPGNIPKENRSKVIKALEILSDDIYRAGPVSVIDRSRDSAAVILSTYLEHVGGNARGKDLGPLIKILGRLPEEKQKNIVRNSADTIRLLHSRGKPSEHEKRNLRVIYEQDAEHAIQCIGMILCDLGWAEWHY